MNIRKAATAEAHHAVAVWREVAMWLQDTARELWDPDQFSELEAETMAARGELVLAFDGNDPAACMILQPCDPLFWPGATDDALYLHRLAVRRPYAGMGWSTAMIEWASAAAKDRGADALRLDCAPRPALIRLYEEHGFCRVDAEPVSLGGFEVVRFERLKLVR
jgi:GNAT superfamily N-acetyltransferase